jgi:hypothetical protein
MLQLPALLSVTISGEYTSSKEQIEGELEVRMTFKPESE